MYHALCTFAVPGGIHEGPCADFVLKCVHAFADGERDNSNYTVASWFLFESEKEYAYICREAGIDGDKLRAHLQLCEMLDPNEMDRAARSGFVRFQDGQTIDFRATDFALGPNILRACPQSSQFTFSQFQNGRVTLASLSSKSQVKFVVGFAAGVAIRGRKSSKAAN